MCFNCISEKIYTKQFYSATSQDQFLQNYEFSLRIKTIPMSLVFQRSLFPATFSATRKIYYKCHKILSTCFDGAFASSNKITIVLFLELSTAFSSVILFTGSKLVNTGRVNQFQAATFQTKALIFYNRGLQSRVTSKTTDTSIERKHRSDL